MNQHHPAVALLLATPIFVPFALATAASGGQIPIVNHSFEVPNLGPCQFTNVGMTGWSSSCGSWGSWNPGTNGICFNYGFNDGVPDGEQTSFVNCINTPITQVLGAVVDAGEQYTLVVEVGKRTDCCAMVTYRIRLKAGALVIAEDNNTLEPPTGGWATSVISFEAPPGHPAVGQSLGIELTLLQGVQGNFDNVRLFTGPYTPEVTPGDLDGDGAVNGGDLGLLLGSWGPCQQCAACPADLDGDCVVGGSDLGILLGAWGT